MPLRRPKPQTVLSLTLARWFPARQPSRRRRRLLLLPPLDQVGSNVLRAARRAARLRRLLGQLPRPARVRSGGYG